MKRLIAGNKRLVASLQCLVSSQKRLIACLKHGKAGLQHGVSSRKKSGRLQRNVKARLLSATTGSGRRNAASRQGLLANNTPLQRALQRSWQGFAQRKEVRPR